MKKADLAAGAAKPGEIAMSVDPVSDLCAKVKVNPSKIICYH